MTTKEDVLDLFSRFENETNSDLFLYVGELTSPGSHQMVELLKRDGRKKAVLVIGTYGGAAEASYRIARSFQRCYDELTLVVPGVCKSAGTLLSLAATDIVMTHRAELGPLDIQVNKRDELFERTSGLNTVSAIKTMHDEAHAAFLTSFWNLRHGSRHVLTTKTAADIAVRLTGDLFAPICQQIDPMRVTEMRRLMDIAGAYGKRIKSPNVKPETLDKLMEDYPEHGFIIDREEARELFTSVREPDALECEVLAILSPIMEGNEDAESPFVQQLTGGDSGDHDQHEDEAESERGQDEAITDPRAGGGEARPVASAGAAEERGAANGNEPRESSVEAPDRDPLGAQ